MSRTGTGDDAVGGSDAAAVNRSENIPSGSKASTFWKDSTFALVYNFHSDSTGRRGGGGGAGYGLEIFAIDPYIHSHCRNVTSMGRRKLLRKYS